VATIRKTAEDIDSVSLPGFLTITQVAKKTGMSNSGVFAALTRGDYGQVFHVKTGPTKIVYLIPEGRVH
jgi:hypothetical protein